MGGRHTTFYAIAAPRPTPTKQQNIPHMAAAFLVLGVSQFCVCLYRVGGSVYHVKFILSYFTQFKEMHITFSLFE